MNVSMMDSFNLSWKLAHSLHGLTPRPQTQSHAHDSILATFASERASVARQLIEFDSKFSSMFSGQIGVPSPEIESLTHAEFLKVFKDGSGFTSGCGIEYEPGVLVRHAQGPNNNPVRREDPSNGTLIPGRRLLNVRVKRFADSNIRDLQDGKSFLLPFLKGCLRLLLFGPSVDDPPRHAVHRPVPHSSVHQHGSAPAQWSIVHRFEQFMWQCHQQASGWHDRARGCAPTAEQVRVDGDTGLCEGTCRDEISWACEGGCVYYLWYQ
jgi:hypothetical protein